MTEDRDIEVPHELSAFTSELRRLADALDNGDAYVIEVDGEEVTIPADAMFAVAHEREDGEVELEFQITWSEADADDDTDADMDEAPEPEPEQA
jgi:amphi-Trp domain-containing protein